MFTKAFWKDAAERAIKTFAQVFVASGIGMGTGLFEADWLAGFSLSLSAAVISVLTSVASAGVREKGTASLI
jgi:cell division GTPase FtsZ